mgnify:CR=1 FL=1
MTVFKAFWKIVKKYKVTVILYTVMLIIFGGISISNGDNGFKYTDSKPRIYVVNNDLNNKLTENFISYLNKNSDLIKIKDNKVDDAIFYKDIDYVIYIPELYGNYVLNGLNPILDIKKNDSYDSALAQLLVEKYIKVQNVYANMYSDENIIVDAINNNLNSSIDVDISSSINISKTSKMTSYFNYASYSILAIIIYIICLVLFCFKNKDVSKRILVSSTNMSKHNKLLLLSSLLFCIIIWILFVLLGVIIIGRSLFSIRGIIYIFNMFLFIFNSLTFAFFISSIFSNKNAIVGIVNVVALGEAFLCGAFVPVEWLPSFVVTIAHIFPTYWYINTNNLLGNIDIINLTTIKPIIINSLVIICFMLLFIILNNIILKKQKSIEKL